MGGKIFWRLFDRKKKCGDSKISWSGDYFTEGKRNWHLWFSLLGKKENFSDVWELKKKKKEKVAKSSAVKNSRQKIVSPGEENNIFLKHFLIVVVDVNFSVFFECWNKLFNETIISTNVAQ